MESSKKRARTDDREPKQDDTVEDMLCKMATKKKIAPALLYALLVVDGMKPSKLVPQIARLTVERGESERVHEVIEYVMKEMERIITEQKSRKKQIKKVESIITDIELSSPFILEKDLKTSISRRNPSAPHMYCIRKHYAERHPDTALTNKYWPEIQRIFEWKNVDVIRMGTVKEERVIKCKSCLLVYAKIHNRDGSMITTRTTCLQCMRKYGSAVIALELLKNSELNTADAAEVTRDMLSFMTDSMYDSFNNDDDSVPDEEDEEDEEDC